MCPPCVIWTTHNAVMCVLHVIQKTICTDLCLYRLCVSDRFSVPWGSDIKFLRMKDTRKSPFGFVIFVLAVEVGVLFQINMIFFCCLFWSEEWCCCEVCRLMSLRSTLAPLSPSVLSVFPVWSFSPCVLCVAPKCTENPTQHCHVKFFRRFLKLWMFLAF